MRNEQKYDITEQISNVKKKTPMIVYLTVFIFVVCCVTAIVLLFLFLWLMKIGVVEEINLWWAVVILMICSIAISTSLVRGFGNKILFGSLRQIIDASKAVANGDFSQRLESPKEKETAEICDSFNEMVDKLGNNEMLARDFVANVSHQFRTPLSSIHGYAQLLESENLTKEERNEYISVIKDKSISLSELVNDILELSRLEHQSSAISKETFSLDEQLRKCLLSMDKQLDEKNIDVVLDLKPVKFFGNRELLAEVWNNLLENAIKFSYDQGKIEISLDSDEENIIVKFKDNGIGMSEETKERIYDRFYRGNEVHDRQGSGLGLAMVNNIIEKHEGFIKVESELEKGSEFAVFLPFR
jgi:signal transduction histidine kinase